MPIHAGKGPLAPTAAQIFSGGVLPGVAAGAQIRSPRTTLGIVQNAVLGGLGGLGPIVAQSLQQKQQNDLLLKFLSRGDQSQGGAPGIPLSTEIPDVNIQSLFGQPEATTPQQQGITARPEDLRSPPPPPPPPAPRPPPITD